MLVRKPDYPQDVFGRAGLEHRERPVMAEVPEIVGGRLERGIVDVQRAFQVREAGRAARHPRAGRAVKSDHGRLSHVRPPD